MEKDKSFDWIVRIIETCTTPFHFEAIDNLIALHYQSYKDDKLETDLELLKVRKWNEIHFILK